MIFFDMIFFERGVPGSETGRAEMPMASTSDPSHRVRRFETGPSGAEAAAGVGAVSASALPPIFAYGGSHIAMWSGLSGISAGAPLFWSVESTLKVRQQKSGRPSAKNPRETVFSSSMDRFRAFSRGAASSHARATPYLFFHEDHCSASSSVRFISTCAPATRSAASVCSLTLWLRPATDGTKIIAVGQRRCIICAS